MKKVMIKVDENNVTVDTSSLAVGEVEAAGLGRRFRI